MYKSNRRLLLAGLLLICYAASAAASGDHDHDYAERLALSKNADRYACQLPASSLCREYPVPDDVADMIPQLEEGCQSMPQGVFSKGRCPATARVGRCIEILRNYHNPKSLFYDNHYYGGEMSRWNTQEVKTTCTNLTGHFIEN